MILRTEDICSRIGIMPDAVRLTQPTWPKLMCICIKELHIPEKENQMNANRAHSSERLALLSCLMSVVIAASPSALAQSEWWGTDGDDAFSPPSGTYDDQWTIFGLGGNDSLFGGSDSDDIWGGEGDDFLAGNEGDDWLYGNQGSDNLFGNSGNDTVSGGFGDDVIFGGNGCDDMDLGPGADYVVDSETQWASDGDHDTINARDGDNTDIIVAGPASEDTINADPGDTVYVRDTEGRVIFQGTFADYCDYLAAKATQRRRR